MKKFIYLCIVLATLSLSSFRTQEEIVQLKDIKSVAKTLNEFTSNKIDSKNYAAFDSSSTELDNPTSPPRD
ncbi:hypothetical protein [Halpernia sp.]|uniref:hypothetical protein n=1 Tax=Halpernia sp. TaxID=2782209 RepID=UPI003A92ADF2